MMGRSGSYAGERVISLPAPDYEADDVLVVREPEQLRALGDDLRSRIVVLLRERALSTTELAERLELPKSTVGHHVKVLEKAGLVRVVRTRQVRAPPGQDARMRPGSRLPLAAIPSSILQRSAFPYPGLSATPAATSSTDRTVWS